MREFYDMMGFCNGKLNVIERSKNNMYAPHWICECKCGKTVEVTRSELMRGVNNCGCGGGKRPYGVSEKRKNEVWFSPDGKYAFVTLFPTESEMICDVDVWETMKQYTWHEINGRVYRYRDATQRRGVIGFSHEFYGGKMVYYKNGDLLDCRRENLSNKRNFKTEDEEYED